MASAIHPQAAGSCFSVLPLSNASAPPTAPSAAVRCPIAQAPGAGPQHRLTPPRALRPQRCLPRRGVTVGKKVSCPRG
uniref:Uncharacterized protein n=1 Tax=Setaria viridis TaxID=4556 RepID=A0A4U6TAR8_SETVI|nr:hypothetical protein SEVIR_9G525650v2 [Setaria viridis]